ncbi:MAG: hypothetical protein AAFR44_07870, partial [Pseudomonadota bacterium]
MAGHDTAAGASAPAALRSDWIDWEERADPPVYQVALWPNRSLGHRGQRGVIAIAAAGFCLPLAAAAGTMAFWGLLPFCAAAVLVPPEREHLRQTRISVAAAKRHGEDENGGRAERQ